MKVVTRRVFHLTAGLVFLKAHGMAGVPGLSLRGKLVRSADDKPALQTSENKPVYLKGDEPTVGVLNDKRLWGTDFEVVGHFNSPGHFEIDPIHTRAMFVPKDGKRLTIPSWCAVSYIPT